MTLVCQTAIPILGNLADGLLLYVHPTLSTSLLNLPYSALRAKPLPLCHPLNTDQPAREWQRCSLGS